MERASEQVRVGKRLRCQGSREIQTGSNVVKATHLNVKHSILLYVCDTFTWDITRNFTFKPRGAKQIRQYRFICFQITVG